MLGFEYSLWSIVALGGALDVVGMSLVTDKVKAGMVKALLGIDDEVDDGSRSFEKIDNIGISLRGLLGITSRLNLNPAS